MKTIFGGGSKVAAGIDIRANLVSRVGFLSDFDLIMLRIGTRGKGA